MNQLWAYKNFNMGHELDISGEFIYDGIEALNEMICIEESSPLFSFLYHTSVGIERLQKIIIVLFEDINFDEYEEFEKSLITHSHQDLHSRIKRSAQIEFNNRENDFLMLSTNFYKSARYNRFNINTSECKEANLFVEFVKKHLKPEEIEYHFISRKVMVNERVKSLVGRTLGSIANKYYSLIREGANKNGTYTYELLADSKAEKIFLGNYRNKSLQEMKITESIAVKELIACIRNTEETCAFLRFLDEIEPLDIDVNLINEYLSELSMGNIPQILIDEVETLYEEIEHPKNRIELISLIGDTCVAFEFPEIQDIIKLINDYIGGELLAEVFAKEFEEKATIIDDEEFIEIFEDLILVCKKFIEGQMHEEKFRNDIVEQFEIVKDYYSFLDRTDIES